MTRTKKGFTLVEMLIVIAIIAILIAIAIPTFATQLEKARVATDKANFRAAKSLAVADYLLNNVEQSAAPVVYNIGTDTNGNLEATVEAAATALTGVSTPIKSTALTITVTDGEVTGASWTLAADGNSFSITPATGGTGAGG